MKRFDQINMIPFIDIMLVLLAIVLTTATFISQGVIEIDLPQADNSQPLQQQSNLEVIEIAVTIGNMIYIDGEPATRDQLAMKLEKAKKEASVLLRVDKGVVFENFVDVIDLLKKNKLEKLRIITKDDS